jgi:hypothetical protein
MNNMVVEQVADEEFSIHHPSDNKILLASSNFLGEKQAPSFAYPSYQTKQNESGK